jgi:hypothetical protein
VEQRIEIDTTRGPLEWSFEPPSSFKVLHRAVPPLGYPWEVAGAGDWDFPPNCPTTDAEKADYADVPRLDLMPERGVFLWLIVGDLQRDYEVEPRSGPPLIPGQFLAPTGKPAANGISTGVAPLGAGDRLNDGAHLSKWDRLVFLTEADGTPSEEPLYLMVKAYAGSGSPGMTGVNSLIVSLRFSYGP